MSMRLLIVLLLSAITVSAAVNPGGGSSSGSGAVAIDSDASAYVLRVGITDTNAILKISGFVSTLKQGGLWGNLVDAAFCRSNLNVANVTNNQTWQGNTPNAATTVGTLVYNTDGIRTADQNARITWRNLTHTPTCTVVVQWKGIQRTRTEVGSTFFNYSSISQLSSVGLNRFAGKDKMYSLGTTIQDNFDLYDRSILAEPFGYDKVYFLSTDPAAARVYGYVDTFQAGSQFNNISMLTNSSGSASAPTGYTEQMTNVWWGFPNASLWVDATIRYWVIFNKVLTSNDNYTVMTALRCLDPQPNNFVISGDSRSMYQDTANHSWAGDMAEDEAFSAKYRLYGMGISGIKMSQLSSNIYSDRLLFAGPSPWVKESIIAYWASANDFLQSSNTADVWTATTNWVAAMKGRGYQVWDILDPDVATYAPLNSIKLTNNAAAGLPISFDTIIDPREYSAVGVIDANGSLHLTNVVFMRMIADYMCSMASSGYGSVRASSPGIRVMQGSSNANYMVFLRKDGTNRVGGLDSNLVFTVGGLLATNGGLMITSNNYAIAKLQLDLLGADRKSGCVTWISNWTEYRLCTNVAAGKMVTNLVVDFK